MTEDFYLPEAPVTPNDDGGEVGPEFDSREPLKPREPAAEEVARNETPQG